MKQLNELISASGAVDGRALEDRVARAATALASIGVGVGDRVALLMRNDQPLVEALLATQHLGAYPVPLNWHAKADEIHHVLTDCGASVLIAHADLLAPVASAVPTATRLVPVAPSPAVLAAYHVSWDGTMPEGAAPPWSDWIGAQTPIAAAAAAAPESIIYTSGTTGLPKGVRRLAATPDQQRLTSRMRETVFGIVPGARVLVPAPLYHTAPNFFALRAARIAELLVLPARFDAEGLLANIERHRITHLYAVPTIFIRLLALPEPVRRRYHLGSLAFALHAGAPCPPDVKRRMIEWWGPVINEYYGSTEAGPSTFVRAEEWLERPGTIGRPVDGVRIEVRDAEDRPLDKDEVGELFVWNDGYADFTYLNRPQARAELQQRGMMATGDLGRRDAAGYYYLCDRKRDLVISGGVNLYPAEIEAILQTMPGVADCAVFGIPDPEFGEGLAALVEPMPGHAPTEPEIRAFLKRRLADFKVPRRIELRASLPREESGKIRKRLLREPYWQDTGRQI